MGGAGESNGKIGTTETEQQFKTLGYRVFPLIMKTCLYFTSLIMSSFGNKCFKE